MLSSLSALLALHTTTMRSPPLRRHAPIVANEDESASRAQLERLFRSSSSSSSSAEATMGSSPPGVLFDLPLWRVQWTALPGHNQLLHVHVPHYCHMFEQLLVSSASDGFDSQAAEQEVAFGGDGADAPCFGHLLLPGGSANLDKPESLLARGTRAPTIGTLMRLREVRRMADGRLAVHAEAVGRFRVLRGTQASPYSKADVALLPDAEETLAWLPAVEKLHGELSPRGRLAAARAAAAAAAGVWASHEAAPLDPSVTPSELAPFNLALDEPSCAAQAHAAAEAAAAAAGQAAALDALAVADEIGDPLSFRAPGWGPWSDLLGEGCTVDEAEDAAARGEDDGGCTLSAETLLAAEQSVWTELITCLRLTRALRTPTAAPPLADSEVPLPEALRMLLPPPPDAGWPDGAPIAPSPAEWLGRYPPQRRAQRLSYLLAALLPDLDRQKLLQCSSTASRLDDALLHLRETSGRLAALAALKGLS